MKILELIRLETNIHEGTRGVLRIDKELFCITLELPWKMNRRNISCIPTGQYELFPYESPRFGNTFSLTNVPNRSNILFHYGNTIQDTSGCILLGERLGTINGNRAILNSRKTFIEFMKLVGNKQAHLTILELF